MYESPIEVMFRDIENRIREQEENAITTEISRQMGVNVDKNELMKALAYDRDQYHKGYEDAKKEFERLTGEWVFEGCEWRCTICGETPWYFNRTPVESGYKFCPYCGAKMRKGD